jgi:hypothetical protein
MHEKRNHLGIIEFSPGGVNGFGILQFINQNHDDCHHHCFNHNDSHNYNNNHFDHSDVNHSNSNYGNCFHHQQWELVG